MSSFLRRARPSRLTGRAVALTAVLTLVPGALVVAGTAHARPVAESRVASAVTVAHFAFTPKRLSVPLGGLVVWTFPEPMNHTTTSDNGFWDSRARSGGATFGHTFATAGGYPYHCRIHASMHGKVVAPMTAAGSATKGWHLRWASAMPTGFTVDVQVTPTRVDIMGVAAPGDHTRGRVVPPGEAGQLRAPRSHPSRRAHLGLVAGRDGQRLLTSRRLRSIRSRDHRPALRHPHPPHRRHAAGDGRRRGRRRRLRRGPDRRASCRSGWPGCSARRRRCSRPTGSMANVLARRVAGRRPARRCSASRRRTSPGPSWARTARSPG